MHFQPMLRLAPQRKDEHHCVYSHGTLHGLLKSLCRTFAHVLTHACLCRETLAQSSSPTSTTTATSSCPPRSSTMTTLWAGRTSTSKQVI